MNWLAITLSDDWFLFVQHRSEWDLQNLHVADERYNCTTKIIKVFEQEHEAVRYCRDINDVSVLIEDLFDNEK